MMLEIQVLAWDWHTNVAGLNGFIGSQQSLVDMRVMQMNYKYY